MAPAFVQAKAFTGTAASPTVSFTSNVGAGNAIVVWGGSYISGSTVTSVTDSQGNSYTKFTFGSSTHANITWSIWVAFGVVGGACTVTVNYGSSNNARIAIVEYSGVTATDQAINAEGLSGSGPTDITSGTVTTTFASEMLTGFLFINDNGAVFTPGFGYSLDLNDIDNTFATLLCVQDQAVSSIGMYESDGSFTGAFDGWSMALITLSGAPPTYSISGNAGLAGATVSYSGTSSGSVTADGSGDYTISGLSNGAYTITPSSAGYNFTPPSQSETVSGANITGVDFTAALPPTVYSVPDCRDYATFPNSSRDVQGTEIYDVQTSSNSAVPGEDSREEGAPVDSRVVPNIPENSRTSPPF